MPIGIYEAFRAMDGSGAMMKGKEISKTDAATLRKFGGDVVICGDDLKSNRKIAQEIEATVGPYVRHVPHISSGALALPHFQQLNPPPVGHTFYETEFRRVKGKI
jgi:hypothetical protein